jgi:hypothetical protein
VYDNVQPGSVPFDSSKRQAGDRGDPNHCRQLHAVRPRGSDTGNHHGPRLTTTLLLLLLVLLLLLLLLLVCRDRANGT